MIKYKFLKIVVPTLFVLGACTKLPQTLNDGTLSQNGVTAAGLLTTAYNNIDAAMVDQSAFWALEEQTSDELLGPTRATDWDDNGRWRKLHAHTYDATHDIIAGTYESLLIWQYNATNVLRFNPTAAQKAEARFLRAYSMYCSLVGWGQVAFRSETDNNAVPTVLKAADALTYITSELSAIIPDLPERNSTLASKANKDAARFLLMKCYLNKGLFLNRTAPTFAASDMTQVITLAGQISGTYSLANNYFDNFSEKNVSIATENIFTDRNDGSTTSRPGNNVKAHWFCTTHYNQNPGGWNGWCTMADFYNKFESTDSRVGMAYNGVTNLTGLRAGFLVGQQFDAAGNKLKDRNGVLLAFTPGVNLSETTQPAIEQSGIRVIKYTTTSPNSNTPTNDYVFFRYSDVLLMKAEASLRNGDNATALALVNSLRTKRGASSLTTLTNTNLIDERGRELYWEGWRREDLQRFGTFLQANATKPTVSDAKYLLFPIPSNDLAANPNLTQNPGF